MRHTPLEQLLVPVYCPVLTWGSQVHSWSPSVILFSPVGPMYIVGPHLSFCSHLLFPCTSLVPVILFSPVVPMYSLGSHLSSCSHPLLPCTSLVPICHSVLTYSHVHPWSLSVILFSPGAPMYIFGPLLFSPGAPLYILGPLLFSPGAPLYRRHF